VGRLGDFMVGKVLRLCSRYGPWRALNSYFNRMWNAGSTGRIWKDAFFTLVSSLRDLNSRPQNLRHLLLTR